MDFFSIPYVMLDGTGGFTGYLDFFEWEKIDYPVMWGHDRLWRRFLVIKCKDSAGVRVMQTFFQRYRHGASWAAGTCYKGDCELNSITNDMRIDDKTKQALCDLIFHKSTVYKGSLLRLCMDWKCHWEHLVRMLLQYTVLCDTVAQIPNELLSFIVRIANEP